MARVLLVEDDAITALHFHHILAAAGHSVTICLDGVEAINQCAAAAPELVITDYRMPGIDGAGFIAWLRRSEHAQLPIILITGAPPGDLPAAIASDLLLCKPFPDEDLLRTVEIILARAGRARRGEALEAAVS